MSRPLLVFIRKFNFLQEFFFFRGRMNPYWNILVTVIKRDCNFWYQILISRFEAGGDIWRKSEMSFNTWRDVTRCCWVTPDGKWVWYNPPPSSRMIVWWTGLLVYNANKYHWCNSVYVVGSPNLPGRRSIVVCVCHPCMPNANGCLRIKTAIYYSHHFLPYTMYIHTGKRHTCLCKY